ncbi:MAG TPA: serine hydrolase domain-containing protein [Puia sp.]|uniref:serine hydrolase domain-containing protein n=1 Tax=Puia sp. TaxID=2045100 RepID=UPI002B70CC87|nr:serine hydrolase domain-containing protein [Puia sp.]HVU95205.1 serine hydrolase domain-containing protein [Puia sp.]
MRTISALILLLTTHFAYPQPALESRLDSFFHQQSPAQPGFVLSIEKHGQPLYYNTTGHGLDSTTNFRMASVTKQFTAMAILLLEKQGALSVDDPIGRWLPELPLHVGKTILIRHLLTHSSGLLDYENLIPVTQTTQVLDADVLRLLSTHDSTLFPPGSRFRYSNSGYCLLALIIQRVAHTSFSNFVATNIFLPLHMDSSAVYIPGAHIPRRAMGYPNDQSVTSATKGDGGVYTSLNDYAKWTRALQQNKLINLPTTLKRLRFPINPTSYYAAGWFEYANPPLILFHSGSTCGFSNFVIQLPADELSIVFFSNLADNQKPFETINRILKETNFADLEPIFHLHDLTR